MAAAASLDPPRAPGVPPPQPLPVSLTESGSPHRPGLPGLNSEPLRTLHPYRQRGIYPDPGLADSMRRRNPAIDSAMTARYYRHQGRPWRCLIPKEVQANAGALAFAERVRQQVYGLRGGLAGVAAEFADRADQFGFGMAERVWAVDARGEFRLADLVWVESWQVWSWLDDGQGFPLAVRLRSASGVSDPIPIEVFARVGRRDNSRLPEGHSALRSLWWRDEDIRRMLVAGAKARNRIGLGKRIYKVPDSQKDSTDLRAYIEREEAKLNREDETHAVMPEELTIEPDPGPSLMPQYREDIRAHEHSIARVFGDTLSEEGVAVAGARAAVVEQRKTADLSEQGQCATIAMALTRELVWPIYDANGRPREEAPYIFVAGFADVNAWRALRELLAEDTDRQEKNVTAFWEDSDIEDMRKAARLGFGLGADHV